MKQTPPPWWVVSAPKGPGAWVCGMDPGDHRRTALVAACETWEDARLIVRLANSATPEQEKAA